MHGLLLVQLGQCHPAGTGTDIFDRSVCSSRRHHVGDFLQIRPPLQFSPLHRAAAAGQTDLVVLLLDRFKAQLLKLYESASSPVTTCQELVKQTTRHGYTALDLAAQGGDMMPSNNRRKQIRRESRCELNQAAARTMSSMKGINKMGSRRFV